MKKSAPFLLLLLLTIFIFHYTVLSAFSQESYALEYKFPLHDQLQYKTEKIDSITTSMPNGQEVTRQITSYSIRTMTIENAPPENNFTVAITTDSTWSNSENENDFPERGNQPGGRRVRMSLPEENLHLTFDKYGKSTTNEAVVSTLIIPLPEKPVSINDQWNFNLNSKRKGRFQGETTIRGKCLLYDVQQTEGNNTAVIIINAETKGEGKFRIKTPEREMSGTNKNSGTISSLVYFDIDKGRINEIVTAEASESATEGSAFSSSMIRTSKSTTKLINK